MVFPIDWFEGRSPLIYLNGDLCWLIGFLFDWKYSYDDWLLLCWFFSLIGWYCDFGCCNIPVVGVITPMIFDGILMMMLLMIDMVIPLTIDIDFGWPLTYMNDMIGALWLWWCLWYVMIGDQVVSILLLMMWLFLCCYLIDKYVYMIDVISLTYWPVMVEWWFDCDDIYMWWLLWFDWWWFDWYIHWLMILLISIGWLVLMIGCWYYIWMNDWWLCYLVDDILIGC